MRRERSRRRGQILPRKVAVESAFAFDGKGSESPLKIGELSLGRLERRRAGLRIAGEMSLSAFHAWTMPSRPRIYSDGVNTNLRSARA
jgi:hypothetical protein